MIQGVHGMFYSSKPRELRLFLKEKLNLPATDVGEGWLIFDLPRADMGCHPTDGRPPSGTHNISFFCDDIDQTVAELRTRGVQFDDEIADRGYGLAIHFTMPGEVRVELYQPKYKSGAQV